MRKIVTVFLIVFSASLLAQSRLIKPEIYLGANFGVTESMVAFHPTVSQDFLQGYNGGLIFRYIAEKNVGMQAELNFSQRGWKESTGLYTRQLNYIELPFMTHIYIGKKNRFFINLGPKIAYLISEKTLLNQTTNPPELQQTDPIQHPFDFGACAGIGILFNIKGNIFQLDSRFNYSFSDIYANSKTDYFDKSNNLNLSVNLGWLIQVK